MRGKSLGIGLSALVLGGVLVASLLWGLEHAALANPTVLGRPAPALSIRTLTGSEISLSDLRGGPVVLNFWASWCGPCVAESSVLAGAAQSNPDVAFVGADNRDTMSGFVTFEQRHPHSYPAGPIVNGSYQAFGVSGLPETFFLNGDGVVVASFAGPLDPATLDHYLSLIRAGVTP